MSTIVKDEKGTRPTFLLLYIPGTCQFFMVVVWNQLEGLSEYDLL